MGGGVYTGEPAAFGGMIAFATPYRSLPVPVRVRWGTVSKAAHFG